jgi:hypothetical protein
VTLTYLRGEDEAQAELELIAPPETPPRARLEVTSRGSALRGLAAENINPAVIAEYGLPVGTSGVIVAEAQDLARRAGPRARWPIVCARLRWAR